MIRSLINVHRVDPGFEADGVFTFSVVLPQSLGGEFSDQAPRQAGFFADLLQEIQILPGVESAGAVNFLPIDTGAAGTGIRLLDRPEPPPGQEPSADVVTVAGDYFNTMRIPLLQGRHFDSREQPGTPFRILVNQAFAQLHWPDANPLGKRLVMDWDRPVEGEIIGVVGDVLQRDLTGTPRPAIYWSQSQFTYGFMTVVIRNTTAPAGLAGSLRSILANAAPEVPFDDFQSMQDVLSGSIQGTRSVIQLLTLFSALAVGLALVGLYGMISSWVGQRSHELAVRMAVGARGADVLLLVMGHGTLLTLAGLAIGLGGSWFLSQSLDLGLFHVEPTDLLTYSTLSLLFLLASLIACYGPARRATRVDPVASLNCE